MTEESIQNQADMTQSTVLRKLEIWKERLQDLSGRNQLLFFRTSRTSTLEILKPDLANLFTRVAYREQALEFPVSRLVSAFEAAEADDALDFDPNTFPYAINEIGVKQPPKRLNRILYNLRSRARTAQEEQGINILFTVFGFLEWSETETSDLARAPLVLVPVSIERESSLDPYALTLIEDDIILNPSLEVKLRNDFNLELPDLPELKAAGDLAAFLEEIRDLTSKFARWSVREESAISTFNFQNLIIIQDLERNGPAFSANRMIRSISIGRFEPREPTGPLVEAKDLDTRIDPSTVLQVLDADSSQQEAIQAAKAGIDMIIQGPPGTGKSQTIANMIAEFLGEGKSVLFVSQKSAALEVVQQRLVDANLGQFCLQVHSHKRNKLDVIRELGEALDRSLDRPLDAQQTERLIGELKQARLHPNEYIRLMHTPMFGLELTPFRIYGILAQLVETQDLRFTLDGIEEMTRSELNDRLAILGEFTPFSTVLAEFESATWRGVTLTDLPLLEYEQLEETIDSLLASIGDLTQFIQGLAETYSLEPPETLLDSVRLLRVARVFKPSIFSSEEIPPICERFASAYASGTRYLQPRYWLDRRALRPYAKSEKLAGFQGLKADLKFVSNLLGRRREISQSDQDDEKANDHASVEQYTVLAKSIERGFAGFKTGLGNPETGQEFLTAYPKLSIGDLTGILENLRSKLPDLQVWVRLNRLFVRANESGLGSFTGAAISEKLPTAKWPEVFNKRFYRLVLEMILSQHRILEDFERSRHTSVIDQFRMLDRKRMDLAKRQVHGAIRSAVPDASWMKASTTEEAILRKELNKKRRIKPLRRLFHEIPTLLLRLKPCLLMSPYTVSQLLEPELFQFDVVLFDEASQIPPEYAIGGIARARQVIIAGDTKQLPPTRFFQTMELEAEGDDEIYDEFESILNEADAIGIPSKPLLWHYRSRDEALIAFSNYNFYGNSLYTFPNSLNHTDETGIGFHFVPNGIYRRGAGGRDNLIEARRVVAGIIDHVSRRPEKSLGVVTFSHAQKQAVEAELDQVLTLDQRFHHFFDSERSESFFVKNLEAVQGDERDYMIFSIGYGRDETGSFSLNFGPLNREGGERRLNVAVSRARYGVQVYASIQPEDIDLERTNSNGLRLLRSYMEVARDGLKSIYLDTRLDPTAETESPFEQAVFDALTNAGLYLRKQVGVSKYRIDLAVVDPDQPGRFILGIECDGAMYHSAATARDRDRLRQEVLEGLGWTIHRIWSRDWFRNPQEEISRVLERVKDLQDQTRTPGGQSETPPQQPEGPSLASQAESQPSHFETTPLPAIRPQTSLPAGTMHYREARPRRVGSGAAAFWKASSSTFQQVILEVVDDEGPIEKELAIRRVAGAWSIQRVTQQIQSKISAELTAAVQRNRIKRNDGFFWPVVMGEVIVRVPGPGAYKRDMQEISLEEIAEACLICVKTALSIDRDQLLREVSALFDLRLTATNQLRVEKAISRLLEENRLATRGEKFVLPIQ